MSHFDEKAKIAIPNDVQAGDTVFYRLRIIDLPRNPEKEWRGKVKSLFPATEWTTAFLIVWSLEPGYEEMSEIIHPCQITRILKAGTPEIGN